MSAIRTRLGTVNGTYSEVVTSGDNEVVIESARGGTKGMLTSDAAGKVSANYLASRVRYEFWDHNATQSIPTASYTPVRVNGLQDSSDGGLATWNTSSYKFQPEGLGYVYTIRFTGIVNNPAKNGRIHVDLALSGATAPLYVASYNVQKQGYEYVVDSQESHVSLAGVFTVFTDTRLLASGAQLYMTTDTTGGLTLMSASIFIKEG